MAGMPKLVVVAPPKPTTVCAVKGDLSLPIIAATAFFSLSGTTISVSITAAASVLKPGSGPCWMVWRTVMALSVAVPQPNDSVTVCVALKRLFWYFWSTTFISGHCACHCAGAPWIFFMACEPVTAAPPTTATPASTTAAAAAIKPLFIPSSSLGV